MIPAWIKNTSYALAAFIGVNHDAFIALALLMIIDWFTGIIASAVIDGPRSVKSRRMMLGIVSKGVFLLIPASIALTGKAIGQDLTYIVSSTVFIMATSELYSIVGNVYGVKHGKRVPEFDAVAYILKNIREFLEAGLRVKS